MAGGGAVESEMHLQESCLDESSAVISPSLLVPKLSNAALSVTKVQSENFKKKVIESNGKNKTVVAKNSRVNLPLHANVLRAPKNDVRVMGLNTIE